MGTSENQVRRHTDVIILSKTICERRSQVEISFLSNQYVTHFTENSIWILFRSFRPTKCKILVYRSGLCIYGPLELKVR